MYALMVYAFMHMTFTGFHGLYLSQNLKKIPKPLRHIRLGKSRLYNYLLNRDSYATTNITRPPNRSRAVQILTQFQKNNNLSNKYDLNQYMKALNK